MKEQTAFKYTDKHHKAYTHHPLRPRVTTRSSTTTHTSIRRTQLIVSPSPHRRTSAKMPSLTVNEPHPTVAKNSYLHSGRGGAGNFFRAPETTPASGISTKPVTARPSTGRFYSGRGGAGNAQAEAARPVMSFEEQYKLQSHIEQKPVGYVGRGGAGNAYMASAGGAAQRKPSDAGSISSTSSSGSFRSAVMERLSSISSRRH